MHYLTSRLLQFIRAGAVRAIISLVVCAPMLAFAQSSEETALRALVDKFFAAYQKEDINELQSMLDVKSPDYPATKQQIQKVFSDNEKIEIKNLTIRKLSLDGAKWTVRVSLEMSAIDEKTKAEIYGYQNNHELVLKTYQRSLALAEELGAKETIAQALSHIGNTYYSQGKYEKSLEFSAQAGAVAKQIGSPQPLIEARTIAGKTYRSLNQPDQARQAFQEAIDTIETVRGQLAGNEQQQEQFFENKLAPYQSMVELLITQNKISEALAYAERAKARMLLDVLRGGRVNIAKAMTAQEQERERKFNNDLVSINNRISREGSRSQPDPSSLANLKGQLQKARLDYEAFQTNLYAAQLLTRQGWYGLAPSGT